MRVQKPALLLGVLIVLLITLLSLGIPFLWDTAYHSGLAQYFLQNGPGNGVPPLEMSNGNPPLYSLLLALVWAVFGESLLVSHIAFSVLLLFMIIGFLKMAGHFLDQRMSVLAVLLLFADPTMLAQGMLMGYDILLIGLCFWGIWSVLEGKRWLMAVVVSALVLTHFRGVISVAVIFVADILVSKGKNAFNPRKLLAWVPGILLLNAWIILHYSVNGFFLLSGSNEAYIEDIGFVQWLRNVSYIVWKTLDLGRVFLWGASAVLLILFRKRLAPGDRWLILLSLAPVLLHILLFSGSMMPVSHRYFMLSEAIVVILFLRVLRFVPVRWLYISTAGALLLLLSGNFWFYPQRFGNAWDASLIFLPWPDVDEEFHDFLSLSDIPPDNIYAEYPLTYPRTAMWPGDEGKGFSQFSPGDIHAGEYLFYTNFSNMYDPSFSDPGPEWEELWSTKKGRISAKLVRYDPAKSSF